ncbi:MAG TPA: DNA mismatch repair protein MutS [Flavobacteriales bacterium]|nr:DNA mismatch repair protein MutS [Flavobacteriales bacterium]HMR27614.1 DNA mismatch repair protein MutS [Flavobacteriales bacterium]
MSKAGRGETPLMQQYQRIKGQYPDAVLLFRVGDFYETFGEDAVRASQVLGITLTRRNNGAAGEVPLAGFPHHALETYLPRLVRAGHRVAVCDQLEDPKLAKTVVERGVTEVVTPGVAFSDRVVDHRSNNWLAAVCAHRGRYGVAFLDITTGEFLVGEEETDGVRKFVEGHAPSELLYPRGTDDPLVQELTGRQYSYALEDWVFTDDLARERLLRQFGTTSLKGFGVEELQLGQRAAGAVLHYLGDTRHERLAHITGLARLQPGAHVGLDRFTLRNLEVVAPVNEGARTLCGMLDRCSTPMGSRLLKRWLTFPLVDRAAIAVRHAAVAQGVEDAALLERCGAHLQAIGDLERLAGKAAAGRITPRELNQLRLALEAGQALRHDLLQAGGAMAAVAGGIDADTTLSEQLARSLEPEAPAALNKGGVIRPGIDAELDELRHVSGHAKDLLLEAQQRESDRTGIPSLKVGFNNVFGYYLEVRNTHKDKVPPEWVRKQTLVGAERYITDELKALEERILGAEERILDLEARRFAELVEAVCARIRPVQTTAGAVAAFDVLRGFALTAARWGYARPVLDDGRTIDLRDARHPVIEQQLPPGEAYVANDLLLDPEERQLVVITGPNMSGKSALLRQTALIVLMAQAGSFVPASAARIGVVDRIFTRVGASDNLSTGESTFMVEMNETASILNNLTARSLVVLDEIGRGTSTYDGISIAWAIAEHLHEHPGRPRTLFATHYHELNEMAATYPRIRNASVAVREVDGRVHFLRKLVPGGSDRSFGIHVARMAGMPQSVVRRAEKVLAHLERSHAGDLGEREDGLPAAHGRRAVEGLDRDLQLSFFQLDDPALEGIRGQLEALDIDTLTPVEALLKLNEIKRMAGARSAQLRKA